METDALIYIYAPPWAEWSAGIRVLHYLCDELNRLGHGAFLVLHGPKTKKDVNPRLSTPVLTKKLLKSHLDSKRRILTVYPEGIPGNPLKANFIVRWILNFPSLLAGSKSFDDEFVLAYSTVLSSSLQRSSLTPVMFIPAIRAIDMEEFINRRFALGDIKKGSYELIYAQKFRALGGKLPELKPHQVEITRFGKKAPKREETLRLISGAKLVHVYENTTVITEALVLGVPVLCHANEFFGELIASKELPMEGISWDPSHLELPDSDYNLKVLKEAEFQAVVNLQKIFANLNVQETPVKIKQQIDFPSRRIISRHSLSRAKAVLKQKGFVVLFRFFKNYVFRDK